MTNRSTKLLEYLLYSGVIVAIAAYFLWEQHFWLLSAAFVLSLTSISLPLIGKLKRKPNG